MKLNKDLVTQNQLVTRMYQLLSADEIQYSICTLLIFEMKLYDSSLLSVDGKMTTTNLPSDDYILKYLYYTLRYKVVKRINADKYFNDAAFKNTERYRFLEGDKLLLEFQSETMNMMHRSLVNISADTSLKKRIQKIDFELGATTFESLLNLLESDTYLKLRFLYLIAFYEILHKKVFKQNNNFMYTGHQHDDTSIDHWKTIMADMVDDEVISYHTKNLLSKKKNGLNQHDLRQHVSGHMIQLDHSFFDFLNNTKKEEVLPIDLNSKKRIRNIASSLFSEWLANFIIFIDELNTHIVENFLSQREINSMQEPTSVNEYLNAALFNPHSNFLPPGYDDDDYYDEDEDDGIL